MERERQEDREAGRPARGLFTGRGRGRSARDGRDDEVNGELDALDHEVELDDEVEPAVPSVARDRDRDRDHHRGTRRRGLADRMYDEPDAIGPRIGAKRSVLGAIRQIPNYLRLMVRLMRDGRVSRFDRLLVLAAAVYAVSPLDFIPDLIPFLGQVDDVFLIVMALQRLVENAGRAVLADHWDGDPDEVSDVNLLGLISAAGFFLPSGIRRKLRRMAGSRR